MAKVASGAAETVPYITVTNLARTLRELQERGIWVVGTADGVDKTLYDVDLKGPMALVMGPKGRACAASRVRPATNWSASRWPAVSRA